jgi:hypothetical protein
MNYTDGLMRQTLPKRVIDGYIIDFMTTPNNCELGYNQIARYRHTLTYVEG